MYMHNVYIHTYQNIIHDADGIYKSSRLINRVGQYINELRTITIDVMFILLWDLHNIV